jgi:MFS family permease
MSDPRLETGAYRRLWQTPGLAAITALGFLSRLPLGMITVGLLLYVRQSTGTFALAGMAVAVFAVAAAATSPWKGRLLDRYGPVPVLLTTLLVSAVALAALAWLRPQAAALLTLSVIAGASAPPVSPAIRAYYARTLAGGPLRASYALDGIALELIYLSGPALVGLVVAISADAATALLAAAGLTVVATPVLARLLSGDAVPAQRGSPVRVPLGSAARLAITVAVAQAAALGLGEVVVSAAAVDSGQPAAAGALLGVWAAGSIAGGLLYGALRWSWPAGRQYVALLAIAALLMAVLAVADSLVWLGVLLFAAGMPITAAWAAGSTVVASAPESQRGRAYGWLQATTNAGAATGYALGGLSVESIGVATSYVLGAGLLAVAGAVALGIGRATRQTKQVDLVPDGGK